MYLPNAHLSSGGTKFPGNVEDDPDELGERLRKTLYYGKPPSTDRPSLPLTDLAVDFFQEAAPKELGKLDTYFAASASRSACMSPSSVMAGMLYTNRLRKKNPSYLQQVSSSELFLISMMMASKFMYDEGVDEEVFNDEWADAGDMDIEDVNQLEREFLSAIDWELFVRPEEFSEMLHLIEKRIALQQGVDRGWFSYRDLWVLSQDASLQPWSNLTADLAKVIAVSSLAYLAGILTMIGSTLLASTLSTGLVSLGSSMVLPSPTTPVVVPALPSLEESVQLVELEQNFAELETTFSESVLTGASKNAATLVNRQSENETNSYSSVTIEQPEQRKPENSLNNLLPPLLALIALKDSFVDFINALRERKMERHCGHFDSEQNFDTICSEGPCQQETWPNCWNTSDNLDLSHGSAGSWCYDDERLNGRGLFRNLGKPCQNCGANMKRSPVSEFGHENQACQSVRCCCSVHDPYSLRDGIDWHHPAFSELFARGFMTGPGYPVFVTT